MAIAAIPPSALPNMCSSRRWSDFLSGIDGPKAACVTTLTVNTRVSSEVNRQRAALAAYKATQKVPIVAFAAAAVDPVASRLADSLARLGRNVTGIGVSRASRCAIWKLHAPPSRGERIQPQHTRKDG
jgi:hypothetical protein